MHFASLDNVMSTAFANLVSVWLPQSLKRCCRTGFVQSRNRDVKAGKLSSVHSFGHLGVLSILVIAYQIECLRRRLK